MVGTLVRSEQAIFQGVQVERDWSLFGWQAVEGYVAKCVGRGRQSDIFASGSSAGSRPAFHRYRWRRFLGLEEPDSVQAEGCRNRVQCNASPAELLGSEAKCGA